MRTRQGAGRPSCLLYGDSNAIYEKSKNKLVDCLLNMNVDKPPITETQYILYLPSLVHYPTYVGTQTSRPAESSQDVNATDGQTTGLGGSRNEDRS